MSTYTLRGGREAVDRLRLLARAKWPSTAPLLRRAGLRRGMRVLDVGCGIGEVTRRLASLIGREGLALGVDRDRAAIEFAIAEGQKKRSRAEFAVREAGALGFEGEFDFIYIRYLLCHLSDPLSALVDAKRALKPGGVLVVEDIDFDGHICYPPSPAFDEYVRLFKAVVSKNGGDACVGPRLHGLLREAGFEVSLVDSVTPLFAEGEGKLVAPVTLRHVSESLIAASLATRDEIDHLEIELLKHCEREDPLMSLARTFQCVGSNV